MSNTPKLRFKEFNDEWICYKIEDVLIEARLGGNYTNTLQNTGYPLIKMGNIGRGFIDLSKIEYIDSNNVINESDVLKEGDLLFNTRNTLELVGKVSIWKNELKKAYYNSNLLKLTFCENTIKNNYFVNYLFNTKTILERLKSIATGTTSVGAIYTKDLINIKIELPSLPEQEKIASFLSLFDEKIELQEQKVESLKKYKKGMMQKIFSQEIRFKDENGEVYPEWEENRLGNIIIEGKKSKRLSGDALENGEYPFFTNNTTSETKYSNECDLDGEYIISNTGGSAHFKYYFGKFAYMSDCFVFNTDEVDLFVYYFLKNNESYINYNGFRGNGLKHLDKNWFKKIKIKLPHTKEQIKIVSFLLTIDKKIELEQEKLAQLQEYKKGLLQQMFV